MKISPSLLAANFNNLQQEIEMINQSEADWLHLDIMDGVFVPNISFGFSVLDSIAQICTKPLDIHLMIVEPEKFTDRIAKLGAHIMNVHQEACIHLNRTIHEIHDKGMKAAVTLNPATPVTMLKDVINDVDMVLLMSVNPGFGGQHFIENTINKIDELRDMIEKSGSDAIIQIDGGVNKDTAKQLAYAGAQCLVSGSYIFRDNDPISRIAELKRL